MRLIVRFFRMTLIVFLVAATVFGCGKKAPPIPPDSLVPGEVRNFSVQQDGQALSLQWLIPRVNIDRQPLTDIQGFQILRCKESFILYRRLPTGTAASGQDRSGLSPGG